MVKPEGVERSEGLGASVSVLDRVEAWLKLADEEGDPVGVLGDVTVGWLY